MKANCWYGKNDVRVDRRPRSQDPQRRRRDRPDHVHRHLRLRPAPLRRLRARRWRRATSSATSSWARSSRSGRRCSNLKVGDRVVVPFPISCGNCFFCQKQPVLALRELESERLDGRAAVGPLAARASSATRTCSAATRAVRRSTPACRSPTSARSRLPDGLTDEQVLFLSDIFPTGYMAAENCDIEPGDTVAVWGCGPVGQFAIRSAFLLGAERVIRHRPRPGAPAHGASRDGAETINYDEVSVLEALKEMTGGRGPDRCIDAVGMEGARSRSRSSVRVRPRQAGDDARDRPADRACARRSWPAATAAPSPSPASTAGSSTSSRSARS